MKGIGGTAPASLKEVQVWATPRPGMSLDELIEHMDEIGNTVLEVDRGGNRLLLIDVKET